MTSNIVNINIANVHDNKGKVHTLFANLNMALLIVNIKVAKFFFNLWTIRKCCQHELPIINFNRKHYNHIYQYYFDTQGGETCP